MNVSAKNVIPVRQKMKCIFLLLCNYFETDRKNILDLVAGEVKIFHTLSCENKFVFLMNNENISILNTVDKFIKDNLY
jgi:hypothetical protein